VTDTDVDFFEEDENTNGIEKFKAEVTNLAREHRRLGGEVDELKEKMKKLVARQAIIETRELPDLLQQAGVKEITTLEGLKVTTKFIVGGIPAESKEEAFAWLDSNGHSDLIKRNLSLAFDKGATEQAEKAKAQLVEMGFDPALKLDVHPQTFMAFARTQIMNGKMLPLDKWGCFYGDKAVIK